MDDVCGGSNKHGGQVELSVLIPVYNEEATVAALVLRVLAAPYRKQIVVVDDGSTDDTPRVLRRFAGIDNLEVHTHARNRGKGAAVRTALARARGRFTIIQDADLEYDPQDYPLLIEVLRRGEARVVYGSRYLDGRNELPVTRFWFGVKLLNFMVTLLYGARVTDEATCYKAFDTELLRTLDLRCTGFEFCPEVTAKLLKRRERIMEVPIRYAYRTVAAGKKIGWSDGVQAFWTLLKYRFIK